jgi:hypothetical protein
VTAVRSGVSQSGVNGHLSTREFSAMAEENKRGIYVPRGVYAPRDSHDGIGRTGQANAKGTLLTLRVIFVTSNSGSLSPSLRHPRSPVRFDKVASFRPRGMSRHRGQLGPPKFDMQAVDRTGPRCRNFRRIVDPRARARGTEFVRGRKTHVFIGPARCTFAAQRVGGNTSALMSTALII